MFKTRQAAVVIGGRLLLFDAFKELKSCYGGDYGGPAVMVVAAFSSSRPFLFRDAASGVGRRLLRRRGSLTTTFLKW
jgi:hypothetical protein